MGNVIKLINPAKTLPFALLTSIAFFGIMYFLFNKTLDGEMGTIVSVVATVVSFIIFLFGYAAMDKAMASELIADLYEDEEQRLSLGDIASEAKGYMLTFFGIILTFALMYSFIIPIIGDMAGGIFQLSIGDFEFNILTLAITLTCLTWVCLGAAQVVFLQASFMETIQFTFGFIFNNFAKTFSFFLIIVVLHVIFGFSLVYTNGGNQMVMMPIKILIFAYIFGLGNACAINFFVNNVTEEDFAEDENYEE